VCAIIVTAASPLSVVARDDMPAPDADLPAPVTDGHFSALMGNSPFIRPLGLSQSLVLTGVARVGNEVIATLFNAESRESFVVTQESNHLGWQLMGVAGNQEDLASLTAQIKVAGTEVVSIRYEKLPADQMRRKPGTPGSGGGMRAPVTKEQVDEAKFAAVNYREGFQADGYPRQPPPETVAKLAKLSVQQREDINRHMFELSNRGLGLEERRQIYEKMLDRSMQGGR
jgi:hypothetical protein